MDHELLLLGGSSWGYMSSGLKADELATVARCCLVALAMSRHPPQSLGKPSMLESDTQRDRSTADT